MSKILVYVAGPYTVPDPALNTNIAIRAAEEVCALGMVPFIPHLSLLWQTIVPHDYEFWLEYDLHWLRVCDVVLRLHGDSKGADREVAEAERLKIPVVYSIEELRAFGCEGSEK